jgi:hypothetical protein
LKLYLDYEGTQGRRKGSRSGSLDYAYSDAWASAYSGVAAGAALVAGLGLLTYLKRVWWKDETRFFCWYIKAKLKQTGTLEGSHCISILWNFVQPLHSFSYKKKVKAFFLVGYCTLRKLGCVFPCCLYTCNFRICSLTTYLLRLCTRINDINGSLCPFFLTLTNWLGLDLLSLIIFTWWSSYNIHADWS